jgi:glycosyltransferase involved in cell wall biosynthesis
MIAGFDALFFAARRGAPAKLQEPNLSRERGPLQVRLIGKANGVGLSRDLDLLAAALRANGCEVTLRGCEKRDRKRRRNLIVRLAARLHGRRRRFSGIPVPTRYDVNLMLEHVWPQFLHEAGCNVLVPNPEWFDRRDLAFLGSAQRVWAKTALAQELFTARGSQAVRIGFDSEDRYDGAVTREPRFLHLAGRSPLKGTARLRALWLRHPEWPALTIVQDAESDDGAAADPAGAAPNITLHRGYLGNAALRTLQNAHRFHLCTSEAEGWGHYIAEAMSVGAVTITCDAAPMNELVTADRGLLVAAHAGARHNLVTLSLFDEPAMEAAVARLLSTPSTQWDGIGGAARRWFLGNKQGFVARIGQAVAELEQP